MRRLIALFVVCLLSIPSFPQMSGGQIRRSGKSTSVTESTKKSTSLNKVSEPTGYANGHGYVDLGLPSGTLWATCNVGASKPEDYGDYYSWGETMEHRNGKTSCYWQDYRWCSGSFTSLTKYCNDSSWGYNNYSDTLTELDPEDDAAYVNWGEAWRMPSLAQMSELINRNYTTWKRISLNGVYGLKITSRKNGNSVFLPVAGHCKCNPNSFDDLGIGYYWSRSIGEIPSGARNLLLESNRIYINYFPRSIGISVRPVCASRN